MNIWIIDHYSSEPCFGGYSRQYDFAKSLSNKGYNVLVIASSFSHFLHDFVTLGELTVRKINSRANYAYIRTIPYKKNNGIKRSVLNTLSFVIGVKKHRDELAQKFGKPDVIIGCSMHPFTWIAAQKASKHFQARFFVEVRDFWTKDEGQNPYNPAVITFNILEKWAYRHAEKIIYSMSRGDLYLCDKLGINRNKVCWIGPPLHIEDYDRNAKRFQELPENIRSFIGNDFLCVFTGYYKDYEGVIEMLRAAKILQDKNLPIKFLFLGSGDSKEEMVTYAKTNSLANTYIGDRINKELIPAVLRRANICLVHLAYRNNENSWKYGDSKNKINEYLYSNSVIIYGTYQKTHFIETSGAGICIRAYDSQALANNIEKVYYMSPEQREEFGKNARKFILENNTVEVLTERYINLLENNNRKNDNII